MAAKVEHQEADLTGTQPGPFVDVLSGVGWDREHTAIFQSLKYSFSGLYMKSLATPAPNHWLSGWGVHWNHLTEIYSPIAWVSPSEIMV